MMDQPPLNARDIAVLALRDRQGNVSARLKALVSDHRLSQEERSLAAELSLGACRRRGTLEAVLRAFLNQPDRPLPSPLTEILHVAIYQMLFLDRVPAFAAVNEAVEQTARFHHRRQAGMVNGVLRTVARATAPEVAAPHLGRDVVPTAPGRCRKLDRAAFPDPASEPPAYLAAAFSLPQPLAERWISQFGGLERAAEIAAHANARAPLILRVNRLKCDVPSAVAALAADGADAIPHANGLSVVLTEHRNVTELSAFLGGLVQPQDPTATAACVAAAPKPGMKVLDFCAAPGAKTTHLAELMDNKGAVVALDVSPLKLRRIEDNCRRMGIDIVTTRLAEQAASLEPRSFNVVLADVPCSNTGVLSRRAEARWRFDEQRLRAMVRDQQMLAAAAAEFVRPGGRLVYSTCSIEPEECGRVARWLTRRLGRLTLLDERTILPAGAGKATGWHDGGYIAIFQAG